MKNKTYNLKGSFGELKKRLGEMAEEKWRRLKGRRDRKKTKEERREREFGKEKREQET